MLLLPTYIKNERKIYNFSQGSELGQRDTHLIILSSYKGGKYMRFLGTCAIQLIIKKVYKKSVNISACHCWNLYTKG